MEHQFDLFDMLHEDFRFEKGKKLRVVELFSGIGFQRMGMELAEIPHEVVATSEIDRFAIEAYTAIHGSCPNLGSITDITGDMIPKDIDIMTYSFPCTDLSKAGQQEGMQGGTRSGLVYEVMRLVEELKELDNLPKVLIMENVVDLIQRKFVDEFNSDIQLPLEKLGYSNYVETLNAREYGIPQNRDRVFMVSILGEHNYNFPKTFELEYRLKDALEEEVDEKYYLSDKMFAYLNSDHPKHKRKHKFEKNQKPTDYDGWANTITTRESNVVDSTFVIDDNNIRIPEATKKGYKEAYDGDGVYINRSWQKRGVVQDGMIATIKTGNNDVGVVVNTNKVIDAGFIPYENSNKRHQSNSVISEEGLCRTLTYSDYKNPQKVMVNEAIEPIAAEQRTDEGLRTFSDNVMGTLRAKDSGGDTRVIENNLRIRKLTTRETGRLMGMNDNQIDRQLSVVSNSQAYKQHGNGIVAQVIGLIIGEMYYEDEQELRDKVMNNTFNWTK